ncbi:MAG TPA: ABC transporter permease, partial [Usitatibacter sp.]|nr:ABC transporter permease [Usitatibacter sp.]
MIGRDRFATVPATAAADSGPAPAPRLLPPQSVNAGNAWGRAFEVFSLDLGHHARRPLFGFLLLLVGFMSFAMSKGNASIGSGSTSVGGGKAFITSEFALSQLFVLMVSAIYIMFIAVGAGMALIRDAEQKVGEIIHSTPLKPAEYVWGKFFAILAAFVGVLAFHTALMMFFNHGVPHGENVDMIGPFALGNYVRAALLFGVPILVFIGGVSFAFGALTRQPILVFFVPLTVLLGGVFFFWDWSPSWLSPGVNRILMLVDLTGYRWLKETWLDVDRGVSFYNRAHVGLDVTFLLNRLLCVVAG